MTDDVTETYDDDDTDTLEAIKVNHDDDPPPSRSRPPLAVLIAGALLLLAIGAGLAFALTGGSALVATSAPTDTPMPAGTSAPAGTSVPAGTSAPAANIPTSSVPTALPLPQAIGDITSTEAVAQVGDTTITRGDFVRAYRPGTPPSEVIKQLIQVELVVQEAKVENVTVDQKKVDDQLSQIKQQNGAGDDAAFLAFLQKNKISSLEQLRGLLERDQVVERMLLTHTTMEQVHARHILLAATADKVDARKVEADALLKQLQDGADFAQLATQKSEDPGSKVKGGDLGWAPRGLFVPEFDAAVFSMKKDELRLVKSQFGWHIIQLLDLPTIRSLESRDVLNTQPGQKAFTDTFLPWVEKLKSNAEAAQKIKILITDDAKLVTKPGA